LHGWQKRWRPDRKAPQCDPGSAPHRQHLAGGGGRNQTRDDAKSACRDSEIEANTEAQAAADETGEGGNGESTEPGLAYQLLNASVLHGNSAGNDECIGEQDGPPRPPGELSAAALQLAIMAHCCPSSAKKGQNRKGAYAAEDGIPAGLGGRKCNCRSECEGTYCASECEKPVGNRMHRSTVDQDQRAFSHEV
jgi:hypothetical protein